MAMLMVAAIRAAAAVATAAEQGQEPTGAVQPAVSVVTVRPRVLLERKPLSA